MNRLGIAGVLWLVAAGLAIAMTLIFRTDPVQWVVTTAVGVVAAVVGLLLIARPSARVVSASNVVAVVWIVSMPCSPCSSPTKLRHGRRTSRWS